MSRDTMNREGMTFEEWVCAAGVARLDCARLVRPYTESWQGVRALGTVRDLGRIMPTPDARQNAHGYWVRPIRTSCTYYPKKVRDAWKAGEDPSEWRAELSAKE